MSKDKSVISPIAIDLGAKNTGVYFAHYPAGSHVNEIKKEGRVYQLDQNDFTLLMQNRTAKRHQKRGYDRRQMAKRLFKLIWHEEFGFEWNSEIEQTVGFLFNRRGFSFLTEEYDVDQLKKVPSDVHKLIKEVVKDQEIEEMEAEDDTYDYADKIQQWVKEEKLENLYQFIEEKLKSIRELKKQDKLSKDNLWNFPNSFNLEKVYEKNLFDEPMEEKNKKERTKKSNNPRKKWLQTHLHHLVFALDKTKKELESGARHRSKYFKEIKQVLEEQNHTHKYLENFCKKLQSGKFINKQINLKLTEESLKNLIGHISNLELRPLRKYFDDKRHKKGDFWDKSRLQGKIERWVLKEWRVGEEDKDKAPGKEQDYEVLREKFKQNRSIIDFWLKEDPKWTIPPYQDNNNRYTPRCQSLILNTFYLDVYYSEWENWLEKLKVKSKDYLENNGNYKEELANLESGKKKRYFQENNIQIKKGAKTGPSQKRNQKHLNARILQFLFDRVKEEDQFHLNEIYSYAKAIKQHKRDGKDPGEYRDKLKHTISKSNLPEELKIDPDFNRDDIFPEKSFLHLVCKYYKLRQRARDSRLFIHPEYSCKKELGYKNTGRFDEEDCLLTYCNHKPRQKRYQTQYDIAAVLRLSPKELKHKILESRDKSNDNEEINDKEIQQWFKEKFRGMMSICDKAAKEQKERRGSLKENILDVYKNKSFKEDLYKTCEKSIKICLELDKILCNESLLSNKEKGSDQAVAAIYTMIQLNNIAFKERKGYSSTCVVCSMDNASRMQKSGENTKASRLPAFPTRVIDGAIKRIARIVGEAIAEDKWRKISQELKAGKKVFVPIITESNQFEFEPSKEELVRGQRAVSRKGKAPQSRSQEVFLHFKEDRIKKGNNTCPYSGANLEEKGEIDHIIPRSSKWGTLNDEANLIWVSEKGNKKKGNKEYFLDNLHKEYKESIFNGKNDNEIKDWIIEKIWDEDKNKFKFGEYKNFLNLSFEEQKAFRHALFVKELREKVINVINNRNRTFVNGTQRYFTEVLANILHKKAKKCSKQNLLKFDYFGVDAQPNSYGDDVYELRKEYENYFKEIEDYTKEKDKKQDPYSHLIDAMMAFMLVVNKHCNEGSLKVNLDNIKLHPSFDKDTGEIHEQNNLFNVIKVSNKDFKEKLLERRKPNEKFFSHRSFTRDTFYADHYLPVLLKRESGSVIVRIGFDLKNSVIVETKKEKDKNNLLKNIVDELFPVCSGTEDLEKKEYSSLEELFSEMEKIEFFKKQLNKNGYCYFSIKKRKLHEYWVNSYNTKSKTLDKKSFIYSNLLYITGKETIEKPENLQKSLQKNKNFIVKCFGKEIEIPAKKEWQKCSERWKEYSRKNPDPDFNQFLRDYFKTENQQHHQKARKVFSLPIIRKQGKMMIRRRSWNNEYTFQIINDSDSRTFNNKPTVPVRLKKDGSLGFVLANWVRSDNIIKLSSNKKYEENDKTKPINPDDWYRIKIQEEDIPDGIEKIWYRIDDSTCPSIAVKLEKDGNCLKPDFLECHICEGQFRKQKEKSSEEVRDEFFNKEIANAKSGKIIIYKGAAYNSKMKTAFKTSCIDNEPLE